MVSNMKMQYAIIIKYGMFCTIIRLYLTSENQYLENSINVMLVGRNIALELHNAICDSSISITKEEGDPLTELSNLPESVNEKIMDIVNFLDLNSLIFMLSSAKVCFVSL